MITPETRSDTSEETMQTTSGKMADKAGCKSTGRGKLLQKTGTTLLSGPGTDKEKIERLLGDDR